MHASTSNKNRLVIDVFLCLIDFHAIICFIKLARIKCYIASLHSDSMTSYTLAFNGRSATYSTGICILASIKSGSIYTMACFRIMVEQAKFMIDR